MTAESDDPASAIAELMKPMMKRELYAIINRPLVPMAEMRPNLHSHLVYMIELEKSGVLFASGPLCRAHGEMAGDGLTIIRADSLEDAEQIAGRDPFVLARQRHPEVRKWIVNEGRITISLDIATSTATLP